MNWIPLVLLSTLFYSLPIPLQRIVMRKESANPYVLIILQQIIGTLILIIYGIFFGFNFPNLISLIPNLLLLGFLYGVGNILVFNGLKKVEASEVNILSGFQILTVTSLGFILLHEEFNIGRVLGILLIFLGSLVVLNNNFKIKFSKHHLLIIIGMIFFGLATINDAYMINNFDSIPSFMLLSFIFPIIPVLIYKPSEISHLNIYFRSKIFIVIFITSLSLAFGGIAYYLSYKSGGDISQISPITQFSLIIAEIIAILFLNERSNLRNKMIGSILAFVGILLLI